MIKAFASDHAQLIHGLLALYDATGKTRWLDRAIALQSAMDCEHLDETDGCYSSARADGALGILTVKEDHDGAEPSPNALAALNLLRLGHLLGSDAFTAKARRIIGAYAGMLADSPHVSPVLAVAALRLGRDPGHCVISPSGHPDAATLLDAARRHAPPDMPVIALPGLARNVTGGRRASHGWPACLPKAAAPAAFLCRDHACGLPLDDATSLADALRRPPAGAAIPG